MRTRASEVTLPALSAALRNAGVAVGVEATLEASRALSLIELHRRNDVRDALRCTLVATHDDQQLFDQLFDLLFPENRAAIPGTHPSLPRSQDLPPAPAGRRIAAALPNPSVRSMQAPEVVERDAAGSASDAEVLATKDFEQMSVAELDAARRLLRNLPPASAQRRTRRLAVAAHGPHLDLRSQLRAVGRGHDLAWPRFRSPRYMARDWLLLIDVSGSMATYARMALHLAHALTRYRGRIETFLFATRLTRVSPALASDDPDVAMARVARAVPDWDSGTRIGECLAELNNHWSRRVLTRAPYVVLLTDGLERGPVESLERELRRLRRNCHEFIWINPLRRNPQYAPLAAGAAVLERIADRRYSAHSIESLLQWVREIESPTGAPRRAARAAQNS